MLSVCALAHARLCSHALRARFHCSSATGLLKWSGSNQCLDVDGGENSNGAKIHLWTCDTSNKNQHFELTNGAHMCMSSHIPMLCVLDFTALLLQDCSNGPETTNALTWMEEKTRTEQRFTCGPVMRATRTRSSPQHLHQRLWRPQRLWHRQQLRHPLN